MPKNNKKPKKGKKLKKVMKIRTVMLIVAFTVCMCINIYQAVVESTPQNAKMSYNQFMTHVENNEVLAVTQTRNNAIVTVELVDGTMATIINPDHDTFRKELLEAGINVKYAVQNPVDAVLNVLLAMPMLLLTFVIVMYVLSSFGGQATTLYKAARPEDIVTFDDVAGMSETKEEVKFAVSQIRQRKRLAALGTRPCKGIILEGPPGTGKTLLAKAIAGEAGVPFISCCGADFIEMFVGLGAARVRSLWEVAFINSPCVLFIDEIDAVGRRRGGASDGASTEANQTLNALLQRMDGLTVNDGIFVIAATNRMEDLDPALLRPGRFDKHLYVGPPRTKKDRDEIVRLYVKNKTFDESFDFEKASKLCFGLTGAQIEQVMNESVLISLQDGRDGIVNIKDIDEATMKLHAQGVKVKKTSEKDLAITSVHEAGHAIVNIALGRKVSKISVIPYSSGIGGVTVQDTDDIEDEKIKTKSEILDDIKVLLAGRMAEQLILGETSVGCSNDIERASRLGYSILNHFAMSEDNLVNPEALRELAPGMISNSQNIVSQVNEILVDCNKDVKNILEANIDALRSLSERLKTEEVVMDFNADEMLKLNKNHKSALESALNAVGIEIE